ncbi:MAG TPA: elongation factor P maturation arginine rhamnosyltransferase EarP, partial [Chitinivibrionales bacterium]|nr:elongation factor P maturation arginine rhamnosyltransferase EarP [Chitinivibrionales bacterium]
MHYSDIDIFCHIVDNFGDAGVAYRFAHEFCLARPSCRTRLFCDDLAPLSDMCPGLDPRAALQESDCIVVVDATKLDGALISQLGPSDVVVEAFGCDIPAPYAAALLPAASAWINLEHLSAERWVDGYHCRQSMLGTGGPTKYFFMPGFTEDTGGVIVDTLMENVKRTLSGRRMELLDEFLSPFGISAPSAEGALFGVVFTYLRGFDSLLRDIQGACDRAYLFVCGEKSKTGMISTVQRMGGETLSPCRFRVGTVDILLMSFLPQHRFDTLLCLADFNLVRGEDSLVRAIFAEKPFVWNAYIQKEKLHLVKVRAFCDNFAGYFDDKAALARYRELSAAFNDAGEETDGP